MMRPYFKSAVQQISRNKFTSAINVVGLSIALINITNLSLARSFSRAREVSIRKVHGATVVQIVTRLLWRFSVPVLMAMTFAWFLGWYGAHRYLEQFWYRVNLSPCFLSVSAWPPC